MRIRRHASKILGTASTIPFQPPVATVAAHSFAGYVCELNRSPWDVFVYPSPPPTPPPPPSDETLEIEEGTMGDEEATSMVTSTGMPKSSKTQEKNDNKPKLPAKIAKKAKESTTGAISTTDLSSNTGGMPEEEVTAVRPESSGMQEEHHNKPKPARKKFEMPDGKITIMGKGIDYGESNVPFTCKKTDGKQWRCKRPSGQPNSFCNYHIIQHRSYGNKKVKAPAVVTPHQTQRNTPTVEGISSYPALGPWRGTGQGRQEIDCIRSVAMQATTEQSKTDDILECDISNVEATTEQSKTEDILECDISNVTHEEDSLEASEEEEKPKRKNANPVSRKRKRRRKPVKVRSLESLM